MNNRTKIFSPRISLFTARTLFSLFSIIVLCLCASIAGYAQNAPATEQQRGAIDPLFENFKSPRRNYEDSFKNLSAGAAFQNQRKAVSPSAGELDPSLNISIFSTPGNVQTTAVQPDGKILVAGFFRTVNDVRRKSIVRLNADFSLDTTFSAEVNGTILAVARQTDGKIVIGGAFTVVGGAARNRVARLNADGSLDTGFNPGAGADALVYDVVIQTDGKILLGGNFARVNSVNNFAVTRLNADGSADASFTSPIPAPPPSADPTLPPIPGIVYSIALQTDGKIFVAGFIVKSYNPSLITTPIVRLNQNGSFDTTFNTGTINSDALKVAVQPDGKILLVGYFNIINGVNRNYIARFNTDGSLDTSFNIGTGTDSPILTVNVQSDGKIFIGGFFSSFNGMDRRSVARLNADGSLDTNFDTGNGFFLRGSIESITPLPGGKVLVSGSFGGGFNIGGGSDSIRVFNADGSNDASVRFNTTALGGVRAIAVQPDGKILVGGNFNRPMSGSTLSQIFRLNSDGSFDTSFGMTSTSFSSNSNGQINSIIVQPDGKIIIAGSNINVSFGGGILFGSSIARLNPDGTTDGSFAAGDIPIGFDGINAAALQPDGKIVIVWGTPSSRGSFSGGIARLNGNGSVDTGFTNAFPASIYKSVIVQPDGKILVGGAFSIALISTQTESIFYNGVVRLNADGSRDTSFVPATTSSFETVRFTDVNSVALQVNGKILVGGRIFTNNTAPVSGAARLNADGTLDATFNAGAISAGGDIARVENILPQPNGKILIGGFFDRLGTTARNNIARLNADGSVDNTFTAATDNTVYKIVTQRGGRVLIGGDFEIVNGAFRTSLARLLSEPVAERPLFDFDGDGKSDISVFRSGGGLWYLLNSASGFTAAQFGAADDKIVPADYDGDGRTDLAVYRSGTWYLQRSSAGFTGIGFGAPDDIPLPADFDGDGRADLVIWRPINGTWNVLNTVSGQFKSFQFGANGDKPIAADFDGDGVADYAVYRPSSGVWYLQRSRLGFTAVQFGNSTDMSAAADYDGDGLTDVAVYRPSNGVWYRLNSSNGGFNATQFGIATDVPAPADYDGDGKTDIAVFRNGVWYVQQSTNGFTGVQFGAETDKPISNAYIR